MKPAKTSRDLKSKHSLSLDVSIQHEDDDPYYVYVDRRKLLSGQRLEINEKERLMTSEVKLLYKEECNGVGSGNEYL